MMHNFEGIFVLHPAVQGLEMICVMAVEEPINVLYKE